MVAGQLEGTLFDVQAAQRKAYQLRQGTYRHPTADNRLTARDVAQAARAASRALQSLPSKVPPPRPVPPGLPCMLLPPGSAGSARKWWRGWSLHCRSAQAGGLHTGVTTTTCIHPCAARWAATVLLTR